MEKLAVKVTCESGESAELGFLFRLTSINEYRDDLWLIFDSDMGDHPRFRVVVEGATKGMETLLSENQICAIRKDDRIAAAFLPHVHREIERIQAQHAAEIATVISRLLDAAKA